MKLLTQQKMKVFGRPERSLYVTNTVALRVDMMSISHQGRYLIDRKM